MRNKMATALRHVVSNSLCYLVNKYKKVAAKPLKAIMSEFYTAEELVEAKDLLLNEIDLLKLDNFPRISRRRRDSNGKPLLDIEDMFTALAHLDEQNVINNLPMFLAASPDGLPSARLMEGDLQIVWTKLTNLGDLIFEIINSNKQYLNVTKSNTDILLRLEQDVAALK